MNKDFNLDDFPSTSLVIFQHDFKLILSWVISYREWGYFLSPAELGIFYVGIMHFWVCLEKWTALVDPVGWFLNNSISIWKWQSLDVGSFSTPPVVCFVWLCCAFILRDIIKTFFFFFLPSSFAVDCGLSEYCFSCFCSTCTAFWAS